MNTIQDQLTVAETANKAGNFAEAEQIAHKLLTYPITSLEKITILLILSESLWRRGFAQQGLPHAQTACSMAEECNDKALQGRAFLTVGNIISKLSDFPRALEYYQKALLCYEHSEQKSDVAGVLGSMGLVYFFTSDFPRALEYYQKALAIDEKINNKTGIARHYGNMGLVYINLSDFPRALEYHQKALTINQELGNKNDIARQLGSIGLVNFYLSDYPNALQYYYQALEIDEELGNKGGVATWLGNIANVHEHLDDYSRALEYHYKALAIGKELGNKRNVAVDLGNIGIIYYNTYDYTKALKYFQEALALDKEINNKSGVARHLGNLGNVYNALSDYTLALEYYYQALAMNEELANKRSCAIWYRNIGTIYAEKKYADYNPILAEEFFKKAIALHEELGAKKPLYEVYESIAKLYEQQGRFQETLEYVKKYYTIRDEVQTEEIKKKVQQMDDERKEAEREKQRAVELAQAETMEKLLYKTFPTPIVPRLKRGEELVVERFPSISVLFADIVGFTKLSLSMKPETTIKLLNFIFTKFDTIIKKASGHRLRTIGDGYFAICGAPDLVENHQYKLAKAALKFMEDIILPENIRKHLPEGTVLDIRIGLHCGEAVCGMVGGLEKWQYDAYGDTINTASRMESHGEAGKIHISEDFKNSLLDYDEFTFIPREPMFIKGKGLMNTYFLQ